MRRSLPLTLFATIQTDPLPVVDREQDANYVPFLFQTQRRGNAMFRTVVEEALALASITLFLAMVAVWAQVLGVL